MKIFELPTVEVIAFSAETVMSGSTNYPNINNGLPWDKP